MNFKKSREIFSFPGAPKEEQERFQEQGEELGRKRVEADQRSPEFKEHKEFLDKVDFKLLQEIFRELAEKSSLDPKQMNFLGPERIVDGSFGNIGEYNSYKNIIGLSHWNIEKNAEQENLDIYLLTLKTLIHEETHATSRIECYQDMQLKNIAREKMGFAKAVRETTEQGSRWKIFFFDFNEGITEKICREVMREYSIRSQSINHQAVEKFLELSPIYKDAREMVDTIISVFAKKTGFSPDFIWKGFIRGIYQGDDLYKKELYDLFEETLGVSSVDALARGELPIGTQKDQVDLSAKTKESTKLKERLIKIFQRMRHIQTKKVV